MRKLLFLMVVVSLVAMRAAAQFQQLIEFQVKPGHEIAFENYIKKIGEAADKMESSMSWSTFSVAVGKPGSTYRVGLLFEKWGDRDAWEGARQVLVEAFGEASWYCLHISIHCSAPFHCCSTVGSKTPFQFL